MRPPAPARAKAGLHRACFCFIPLTVDPPPAPPSPMRHSPAASAATTAPGGTATPSVRLQGARRVRDQGLGKQPIAA
jgi:hypothetical protein